MFNKIFKFVFCQLKNDNDNQTNWLLLLYVYCFTSIISDSLGTAQKV